VLDPTIKDLEKKHMAEVVMCPATSIPYHFHFCPRFAVLDPTIKDLEKKHMAEVVMGPVVFDDFVLQQESFFVHFLFSFFKNLL
jgi:hypothetical protein